VEKHGRAGQATDDNIIWRMRFACWIINDRDINSKYVILSVRISTATMATLPVPVAARSKA